MNMADKNHDFLGPDSLRRVTVVGSGTMGNGIAHVFAQKGFELRLMDRDQEALDRALATIEKNLDRQLSKGLTTEEEKAATLARIHPFVDLKEAVADTDLVVEAASEQRAIKKDIFEKLSEWAPASAVLASNTSSISITEIASWTARPEQVIGMHFMNPVPVMKLVEIILGYATDPAVGQQIHALARFLDKVPAVVQDYPGFVANRILMPMINEAIIALHEGVAGVEEIDTIMKLGMAHPMGPLQLADFIGLDTCLAILQVLHQGFGQPKYAPCPLLVNMVQAGYLGVKTREGFYRYEAGSKEKVPSSRFLRS